MEPVVTVSAAVILRDGEVLLTRRRDDDRFAGQWEFPGGKVDTLETPADALRRELLEEIGTPCRSVIPYRFGYHEYERPPEDPRGPLRVLLLFFQCEIEGEPRPLEVAECRWVPIPELPRWEILKGNTPLVEALLRDHKAGLLGAPSPK